MYTFASRCTVVALAAALFLAPPTVCSAAPGGARPSEPPPPPGGQPQQPQGAGAKPGAGGTIEDPKGDPELSRVCLDLAVQKLRAEYAATQRDPRAAALREKSSYFVEHPAELHQPTLVGAIERAALAEKDLKLVTYVRWQLLSGAPKDGAWEKPLVPRLVELYRRAPVPVMRFGSTAADQKKLDVLLAAAKGEEVVRLSDVVDDTVGKQSEANRIVFAYRDALYAALPVGYDRTACGLRDAFERLGYGWTPKDLMKRIDADATTWANSGAGDVRQYAAAADMVLRLRSERGPRYYVGVGTSRTNKQPYWMTRTEALYEAKKLADLQKLLEEKGNVRRPTIEGAAGTTR